MPINLHQGKLWILSLLPPRRQSFHRCPRAAYGALQAKEKMDERSTLCRWESHFQLLANDKLLKDHETSSLQTGWNLLLYGLFPSQSGTHRLCLRALFRLHQDLHATVPGLFDFLRLGILHQEWTSLRFRWVWRPRHLRRAGLWRLHYLHLHRLPRWPHRSSHVLLQSSWSDVLRGHSQHFHRYRLPSCPERHQPTDANLRPRCQSVVPMFRST